MSAPPATPIAGGFVKSVSLSQVAKVPGGVNLANVAKSLTSIASKIGDGSVNCGHAKYVHYAASVLERIAAPASDEVNKNPVPQPNREG